MKTVLTGSWVALLFLCLGLFLNITVAKADLIGFDGVVEAHKPYIISPSNNNTYSNPLTLDVRFYAEVWGNINFTMVYSIDGEMHKSVPLMDHYFSFVQGEHNNSYVDGSVPLPVLSEGSHTMTVYLESAHEVFFSTGAETFQYFDSETVYFTLENAVQTNPIPSTPQQEQTATSIENSTSSAPSETSEPNQEPFLWLPIAIVTIAFVLVVLVTLVYWNKRKRIP